MDTRFSIKLIPYGNPVITYSIDQDSGKLLELIEPTELEFNLDLESGSHKFILDFNSKTNSTPDMAVEIADINVEGISVDRFKWAGLYRPRYPEPWASSQRNPLPSVRTNTTYLGWNGTWELEFTVPIFAWIHQIEHLGWVYSIDPATQQLHRTK